MSASITAYGPDLAAIHHRGFDRAAVGAGRVLLEELQARRMTSGLVVDLGSGSCILARRMTDAGFDVVGVELSPHMIAIARREAPDARFIEGSAFSISARRSALPSLQSERF